MHTTGSPTIRRALLVDGVFCLVAGLLVTVFTPWLEDELPVAEGWLITMAGLVTSAWGVFLLVASRAYATRQALGAVAIVNVIVVVAMLVWLILEGGAMTGSGLVVVGVLGISVLRFAVYQVGLLRR